MHNSNDSTTQVKDGHTTGSVHAVTGYLNGPKFTKCTCGFNYAGGQFCVHKVACYKYNDLDNDIPEKYRDGFNTALLRKNLAKSRAKTGTKQPVRFKRKHDTILASVSSYSTLRTTRLFFRFSANNYNSMMQAPQRKTMTVIPKYFNFTDKGCTITVDNFTRYHETPSGFFLYICFFLFHSMYFCTLGLIPIIFLLFAATR
jgi:hypothetical protein